jgi:hypothetical protein
MGLLEDRPSTDEILANVRETKLRLAAQMDFSIARIIEDARKKQSQSGHRILSPTRRLSAARLDRQGGSS